MAPIFLEQMTSKDALINCRHCNTNLSSSDNVMRQTFQLEFLSAYLFSKAVNLTYGERERKTLQTGVHWIRPVSCKKCGVELGWYYEFAYQPGQQYKEGKFVLERKHVKLARNLVDRIAVSEDN